MAAEYVLKEGNEDVMLCERGIRTFETAYRFTLDLTAVPVLKELTHLPVIVDPSPRRRPARPRRAAVAGRGRRGRRRDHRRGPPRARGGDLRRPAAARRRRLRRPTPSRSRRRRRSPARSCRSGGERLAARALAVLGVGLIGGSVGLAARERLGTPGHRLRPRPTACWAPRSSAAPSTSPAPPSREAVAEADIGRGRRARGRAARGGRRGRSTRRRPTASSPTSARPSARWSPPSSDERFVGGHPLAGAETAGVEHARADLFDGATWYLTPTRGDVRGLLLRARCTASSSGSGRGPRPSTPATTTASWPRSPTCRTCSPTCSSPRPARPCPPAASASPATGPSFRDATRVAGANSRIWSDIYLVQPRRADRAHRRTPSSAWPRVRDLAARRRPPRRHRLERPRRRRAPHACSRPAWPGGPVRELRVSVPNRPGVVAQLALELGRAGVNIVRHGALPRSRHDRGRGRPLGGRRRRGRPRRGAHRRPRPAGGAGMTRVRIDPVARAARLAAPAAGQVDLPPRRAARRR